MGLDDFDTLIYLPTYAGVYLLRTALDDRYADGVLGLVLIRRIMIMRFMLGRQNYDRFDLQDLGV